MVVIFSWLVCFSGLLYFLTIFTIPFINEALLPSIIMLSLALGIPSAIGLLIVLIKERIKDKKEEGKNDISKF